MFEINNLSKSFTLHHQGSTKIKVLLDISFKVERGECAALTGPSGAGKSTIGAAIMVWSGFALSTRRLILTPWRRRRQDVRQGR